MFMSAVQFDIIKRSQYIYQVNRSTIQRIEATKYDNMSLQIINKQQVITTCPAQYERNATIILLLLDIHELWQPKLSAFS